MDEMFAELIGVNSVTAFNFFLDGLKEVTKSKPGDEMFYVASVLAHYSQTSRDDTSCMPVLANLAEIFDQFFFINTNDPEILEIGGSQILLFAGFFRDQMRHRHDVLWYDKVGQSFYDKASAHTRISKKRKLFENMSESFPIWALRCRDLQRNCHKNAYNHYLIKLE